MTLRTRVVRLAALLAVPASLVAQGPPNPTEVTGDARAFVTIPAKNGAKLTVSTPAFANGGDILVGLGQVMP
jgi:hypothetical protein